MCSFNSRLCNLVEEVSPPIGQELGGTASICVQRAREHSLETQKPKTTDFSVVQVIA